MKAFLLGLCILLIPVLPARADDFKVLNTVTVGGTGKWDYITADPDTHRLYVPRTTRVDVYELDSLKNVGTISDTPGNHGVAIDAEAGHGFVSNGGDGTVTMFDVKTLALIQKIKTGGKPDGIFYDVFNKQVVVLSHKAPNVTLLNPADGSILGRVDLGGGPEGSACDDAGHMYCNIEDDNQIAVVDLKSRKVTGHYALGEGKGPTGIGLDVKNRRIFSACGNGKCIVLDADSGKVLTTLPTGTRTDFATFDAQTGEFFVSSGDGTLTIIKESDPNTFAVEQTVTTKPGARTCSLDRSTGRVYLVTAEMKKGDNSERPTPVPDTFMILVVGRK